MGQLTGTVFAEFAPLYEAAWAHGIAPNVVDACEIWQLAAAVGRTHEIVEASSGLSGDDLLRARVAARERGEAPPEAGGVDARRLAPVLAVGQAMGGGNVD